MSTYPRIPRRGGATGCTGACDQGRRRCETPEACHCEDDDGDGLPGHAMAIVMVIGLLALIGSVLWALHSMIGAVID
jgi:hypothetical protein